MSRVLYSLLNSAAAELGLIEEQALGVAGQAATSEAGLLTRTGTVTPAGVVVATNVILDPQAVLGLGANTSVWQGTGNAKVATFSITEAEVPPEWERALVLTPAEPNVEGEIVASTEQESTGAIKPGMTWAYCLARYAGAVGPPATTVKVQLCVQIGPIPGGELKPFAEVTLSGRGWNLVAMSAIAPLNGAGGEQLALRMVSTGVLATTDRLMMTGATICQDGDPGQPFSGDLRDAQKDPDQDQSEGDPAVLTNYSFAWKGPRGSSPSLAYGRQLDVLELFERQALLDPAPVGQSLEQRRAFFEARSKARHKPAGEVFVELIVDLIRQDTPGFQASGVRIAEHYSNRSLEIEIDYTPTRVMGARVERLIKDTLPAHLKLEALIWGSFILAPKITSYKGVYSGATTYNPGDVATTGAGTTLQTFANIKSSTAIEPGVTAKWEEYWMLVGSLGRYNTVNQPATGIYPPVNQGGEGTHL